MATPEQIAQLRIDIAQPDDIAPWTDEVLSELYDELGAQLAAARVWNAKAAQVAHLVDISEGGSSRKMSDLHKNYLGLAASFAAGAGGTIITQRPAATRPIERP